jgi:DNA-binding beta-propeller fold protein YncE
MRAWMLAAGLLLATPAYAGVNDILIGMDETSFFDAAGQGYHAEGPDALLVLDATDPARPKLRPPIPMHNSVFGPPVNLQITPDGQLGLVASAVNPVLKDGKWDPGTDNVLHVVDLSTMARLPDVTVGDQPQGIAIARDGSWGLVANRGSKDVSVLAIGGTDVRETQRVPLDGSAVAVAIAPDSARAFVVENGENEVAVLARKDGALSYESALDIPTGFNPYNIALTPDGKLGLVVNNGVHGHNASITVFDATGPHPRVIDTLAIGDGPEGFAMAPDGKSAVVLLLHGSTSAHDDWSYHPKGGAVLLRIANGRARVMPGEVKLGAAPEGVAYTRDSRHVYAADFNGKLLHILNVTPKGLKQSGTLVLPGHPASMRGPAF